MNTATITTLITAITALISAVSGLIILVVHVLRHQPIPDDKQSDSSVKLGMITPPPTGKWPH